MFKILVFTFAVCAAAQKQVMCHRSPGNPWNTITVSTNAVPAHLKHGDLMGPCDANCDILCPTDDLCLMSQCSDDCCLPPLPVNCDDMDVCTVDTCGPLLGCLYAPVNCNDGNVCTFDYCDGGCIHVPITGCCETVADCDNGDLCTSDYCTADRVCVHYPKICVGFGCEPAHCDTNTGECVTVPTDCDDGDACTADACIPMTGQCVHANICHDCLCTFSEVLDVCDAPYIPGYFAVTFLASLNNVRVSPTKCSTCSNTICVDTGYTASDYQDCITAYGC